MKTSVALCTYNGEKYIQDLLISICSQTVQPNEIIICDDCSNDSTVSIIQDVLNRYQIPYTLIINENNLGFFRNFKKCISLCTGDVVFLCDQDDVWHDNKVEVLSSIMNENLDVLSITTNFLLINEVGTPLLQRNIREGHNPFFKKEKFEYDYKNGELYKVSLRTILCHNIAPGCTQAIRNTIVKDISFFDHGAHDEIFNTIAGFKNGLYYYDLPLTNYRFHSNQTIGIPYYYSHYIHGGSSFKAYCQALKEFVYILITKKNSDLYLSFPVSKSKIEFRKTLELTAENEKQYNYWLRMAANRQELYDKKTKFAKRLVAFFKQGHYNKFFARRYAMIEKVVIRLTDALALFRKR